MNDFAQPNNKSVAHDMYSDTEQALKKRLKNRELKLGFESDTVEGKADQQKQRELIGG